MSASIGDLFGAIIAAGGMLILLSIVVALGPCGALLLVALASSK